MHWSEWRFPPVGQDTDGTAASSYERVGPGEVRETKAAGPLLAPVASSLRSGARLGGALDFGVGAKGVRRGSAALVLPYARGSATLAEETAASPRLLKRARERLRERIYAASTVGPRTRRLKMISGLCRKAGHPFLPIGPASLEDVMACLLDGKHRSAPSYVSDWKKEHIEAGHPWTSQLESLRRDTTRAVQRGIGPPRRAEAFVAEELAARSTADPKPITKGGPLFAALLVGIRVVALEGGIIGCQLVPCWYLWLPCWLIVVAVGFGQRV